MHFEPSALYQSKWEEDELGTTSSETRTITSSCNYLFCGTLVCVKSNWLQIFWNNHFVWIHFINPGMFQTSFSQMFVCCECSKPTAKFQLECKYSQSEYTHFGSCQFWPTSNFVSATRICHSKLQLFCASCEGLVLSVATEQTEPGNSVIVFGRFLQNISKEQ